VPPDTQLDTQLKLKILDPRISHFEVIDSTNRYLLGNPDLPHGKIVMADFQSAGRGRKERRWQSDQQSSLLFSILLKQDIQQYPFFAFTFLAAIGVHEALVQLFPEQPFQLKWPNDILVNQKKICGILVESNTLGDRLTHIVIGIGLNVNQTRAFFGQNQLPQATSLHIITGTLQNRVRVLKAVITELDYYFQQARSAEPDFILTEWKKRCDQLGQIVTVTTEKQRYTGRFKDLASDGRLILETGGQQKYFHTAEVSLNKEY